MKVFLTGATGFVGSHMLTALLEAGHDVVALVREDSAEKLAQRVKGDGRVRLHEGDALDPQSLARVPSDCEAVIHLIGIIEERRLRGVTFERLHVEATRNVLEVARRLGVKRYIHMSALGSRPLAKSHYHDTKYRAEHLVISTDLPYVIFRPSLIFGPGDGFVNMQKKFIRPFMPVIVPGTGKNLFQPVAIENVVEGFVKALETDAAVGKIYDVGGADRLSFDEVIDLIAHAKGVASYYKVHLPLLPMTIAAAFLQYLPGFPVSRDQLVMLGEDNICNARRFYEEFEISPKVFGLDALRKYV